MLRPERPAGISVVAANAPRRYVSSVGRSGTIPLERESFIDNLLVRILFIIEMIRWTGLAPWEFESSFPGSRTSTFL